MIIQKNKISISPDHFKAFMEVSHDRNPIHTDISYARRTFFGETIFYGMGTVLIALSFWAKGRSFRLLSIQGSFHHPLQEGHSYSIEIAEEDSKVSAKILDHGTLMSKIIWKAVLGNNNSAKTKLSKADFSPLLKAYDPAQIQIIPDSRKYKLNIKALNKLKDFFGLSPQQIPISQLTALLWASYFVGMECPGRRALFSEFTFDFLESREFRVFEAINLKSLHHKTFDLIEISGMATNLRSLKLSAYRIPKIANYPITKVAYLIGKSSKLKGKNIFISGSARGFGSVLSKALALQGATILLNCRKINDSVLQTEREIHSIGGVCRIVEANLSLETSIEPVRKIVSDYKGGLDWIINNASPKIPFRKFKEQTTKDFLSFVEESLSITLNTCYSLLPILNEGGWIFGISSEYLNHPKPGFSHYLASKSALEALLLGLAQEYPKNNFAFFRSPRMLTDQTNLVADLNRPLSAIEVAKHFLDNLEQIRSLDNFIKIEY